MKDRRLTGEPAGHGRGGAISRVGSAHDGRAPGVVEGAGFLLARAGGRAIKNLNRALASFGFRSRHYTVLAVSAESGRSQRDLGELLGIDPSAVVAVVDDLERAGLVRREPHPDDRRTRLVVATDEGRLRLTEARALAEEVDDELMAGLNAAERATLVELLGRIARD